VSKLVNSDTCPRPTTHRRRRSPKLPRRRGELRELLAGEPAGDRGLHRDELVRGVQGVVQLWLRHLGFGRIVASETDAPNMLMNTV
jgi:hypothetical protein